MFLPRNPNTQTINWSLVDLNSLEHWLISIDDINPSAALAEQSGVYAYLATEQAKHEEEVSRHDNIVKGLDAEYALKERLLREEISDIENKEYYQAVQRAEIHLIEKLGKRPAQGTIDAAASADETYLRLRDEHRKRKLQLLKEYQTIVAAPQAALLAAATKRDKLKGILRSLEHRREALVNEAYYRRREFKDS